MITQKYSDHRLMEPARVSAHQLAEEYAALCTERLKKRFQRRSSLIVSPRSQDSSPRSGSPRDGSPRGRGSSLGSSGDISSPRDGSPRKFWQKHTQQIRTETLIHGVNLHEYVARLHTRAVLLDYDPNMVTFEYHSQVMVVSMQPDTILDISRLINTHFPNTPLCITMALYKKMKNLHLFDHLNVTIFDGIDEQ